MSETKKYHVVHVVQSLEVGGMENGIVNIANGIDKESFRMSICCLSHPGTLVRNLTDRRISIFCMNWKFGLQFSLFFALAREFRQRKIDIVHTHGWLSYIYGAVACKLAGIPILINGEHGTFNLDKKRRIIAYKILASVVDKFLAVSFSLKAELINNLNISSDKILTIPNGVDAGKFRPRTNHEVLEYRNRIGLPLSARVIGSVGRIEPVKNYELLVKAFSGLSHEFPTLHCLLVGDGSSKKQLEIIAAEHGVSERFHFLGKANNPQDLIPVMDIFASTSRSEGMSNTILEAMSCAKPIVATDVGGNNEMVYEGQNGFLVESDNVSELEAAIRSLLLDDSKRLRYGANSRQIVEQRYNLNSMVASYEAVYLEQVNSKR